MFRVTPPELAVADAPDARRLDARSPEEITRGRRHDDPHPADGA